MKGEKRLRRQTRNDTHEPLQKKRARGKKQWHVVRHRHSLADSSRSAFAAFCCFYQAGVICLFHCFSVGQRAVLIYFFWLGQPITPCENLLSFSNKFAWRKGMARAYYHSSSSVGTGFSSIFLFRCYCWDRGARDFCSLVLGRKERGKHKGRSRKEAFFPRD